MCVFTCSLIFILFIYSFCDFDALFGIFRCCFHLRERLWIIGDISAYCILIVFECDFDYSGKIHWEKQQQKQWKKLMFNTPLRFAVHFAVEHCVMTVKPWHRQTPHSDYYEKLNIEREKNILFSCFCTHWLMLGMCALYNSCDAISNIYVPTKGNFYNYFSPLFPLLPARFTFVKFNLMWCECVWSCRSFACHLIAIFMETQREKARRTHVEHLRNIFQNTPLHNTPHHTRPYSYFRFSAIAVNHWSFTMSMLSFWFVCCTFVSMSNVQCSEPRAQCIQMATAHQ